MEKSPPSIFDLQLDDQSRQYLLDTARWGRLLAITGLVAGGFIALEGLVIMVGIPGFTGYGLIVPSDAGFGIVFVLAGLLWVFPSYKLLRFSTLIRGSIHKSDQSLVTEAFANLSASFRFWGIMTILMLGMYLLVFLLLVLVGVSI